MKLSCDLVLRIAKSEAIIKKPYNAKLDVNFLFLNPSPKRAEHTMAMAEPLIIRVNLNKFVPEH
ncbi:MAG: hypothetical protein ACI86M_000207 [Saprospiraceae bacterium]|jgi:hypothetical protein